MRPIPAIMKPVQKRSFFSQKPAPATLGALVVLTLGLFLSTGCRAQSTELSPELARTIAVTIRSRANIPYTMDVKVDNRRPSRFPNYDTVTATFSQQGMPPQKMDFLLSKDNKELAQFNTFDISKDLRTSISDDGRPSRGGGPNAPVHIVVYDDLQCPYCARMHKQLFPAILDRYGDKVHIVYKDLPLSIHAWAIHAAVDAGCLAKQSVPAYWSLVDEVHDNLSGIGKDPLAQTSQSKPDTQEAALARAKTQLDRMTLDEGKKLKVDEPTLNACITKQDDSAVRASMHEGDVMNIEGVPALFINGERIPGAVPVEYVWRAIDDALRAQGITPPPAVPLPSPEAGQ